MNKATQRCIRDSHRILQRLIYLHRVRSVSLVYHLIQGIPPYQMLLDLSKREHDLRQELHQRDPRREEGRQHSMNIRTVLRNDVISADDRHCSFCGDEVCRSNPGIHDSNSWQCNDCHRIEFGVYVSPGLLDYPPPEGEVDSKSYHQHNTPMDWLGHHKKSGSKFLIWDDTRSSPVGNASVCYIAFCGEVSFDGLGGHGHWDQFASFHWVPFSDVLQLLNQSPSNPSPETNNPTAPSCILCGDTGEMPGEGDEDDQPCPCTVDWLDR